MSLTKFSSPTSKTSESDLCAFLSEDTSVLLNLSLCQKAWVGSTRGPWPRISWRWAQVRVRVLLQGLCAGSSWALWQRTWRQGGFWVRRFCQERNQGDTRKTLSFSIFETMPIVVTGLSRMSAEMNSSVLASWQFFAAFLRLLLCLHTSVMSSPLLKNLNIAISLFSSSLPLDSTLCGVYMRSLDNEIWVACLMGDVKWV